MEITIPIITPPAPIMNIEPNRKPRIKSAKKLKPVDANANIPNPIKPPNQTKSTSITNGCNPK
jgi:hypothetical protein